MASNSQAWLAGADNSLDNFFRSGPSNSRSALKVKAAIPGTASGRGSTSSNVNRRPPDSRLKRKRVTLEEKSRAVGGSPTKKSRLPSAGRVKAHESSHPDKPLWNKELASPSKGSRLRIDGKGRRALGDVTRTLQNSPHKRGTASLRPSARLKNGKDSYCQDAGAEDEESPSDTDLIDNDVPPRLRVACLAKTPHHPFKKVASSAKEPLPTPPSSNLPLNRALFRKQHGSPAPKELAFQRKESNSKKTVVQTPSVLSSTDIKKSYPTPTSLAVPRFRFPSKSAKNSASPFPVPNFHPDFDDLSLISSTSSPPDCPQSDDHVDKENDDPMVLNVNTSKHEDKADCKSSKGCSGDLGKGKTKDQDKIYTVVPSSQTQYIHYSPTKQRTYDVPMQTSILRRKLFESSTVIPCSQPLTASPSSSQVACLSPRKARKPVPIVTPKGTVALNFVVPTSQEDEQEVRISELDANAISWTHQIVKECKGGPRDDEKLRSKGKDSSDHKQETLQPGGQTKYANTTTESKQDISSTDQAAQFRILDQMLDDLQRLAEKAEMGIVTPSQVLSRPRVPLDSSRRRPYELDKNSRKDENDRNVQDESDQDVETRNRLLVQSSITEPDESQCDEDPFSITNEAYTKHIGLNKNTESQSRSLSNGCIAEPLKLGRGMENAVMAPTSSDTYTQSTETQPDEDDEDPFPDLPPLPSPPPPSATAPSSTSASNSTIDRTAVETLLRTKSPGNRVHEQSSQTEPESETETESETESDSQRQSETQSDNQGELFPSLPPSRGDTGLWNSSIDDNEGVDEGETISTLDVRRILGMDDKTDTDTDATPPRHVVSRFRRRDGRGPNEEESVEDSEEDEETIPTAVREFLSMFPQSQG